MLRTLWSFLSHYTAYSTPNPFAPVHRAVKLRSKRHRNVKLNSTRTGEMGRLLNRVINIRPIFKIISSLFRLVSNPPKTGPARHSARDVPGIVAVVPCSLQYPQDGGKWLGDAKASNPLTAEWDSVWRHIFAYFLPHVMCRLLFSSTAHSRVLRHAAVRLSQSSIAALPVTGLQRPSYRLLRASFTAPSPR